MATFDFVGQSLDALNKINFIYGANGSGKTTISRLIANHVEYGDCCLTWEDDRPLKTLVYNRDFINSNFNANSELKGIFTLGKQEKDTQEKINLKKEEQKKIEDNIVGLGLNIEEQKSNEITNENNFREQCWAIKGRYDADFLKAFEGVRNSKESFAEKCKRERDNHAELLFFEKLKEEAENIYKNTTGKISFINLLEYSNLETLEKNDILRAKIIGKDDVNISALIKKLNNSDWVRQGKSFLQESNNLCPFCQQKAPDDLSMQLEEYFDETYSRQIDRLVSLNAQYENYIKQKMSIIQEIALQDNKYIDKAKFNDYQAVIDSKFKGNLLQLSKKLKEPSLVIELESLIQDFDKIKQEIDSINEKVKEQNRIIDNLTKERSELSRKVWRFIIEELKGNLSSYDKQKDEISKALNGLNDKLRNKKIALNNVIDEIVELEQKITSVKPTINAINKILSSFGFAGFSLKEHEQKKGHYLIVRDDDKIVEETLSEGEKTFITFLYFYHLIQGSVENSIITENRIVVFDDPISSLDSDVLFIVSNLIKKIIYNCRKNFFNIKQVFILTHNTFFYKEVTFNNLKKDKDTPKDETFWIVRKENNISKAKRYNSCPIKTSYELLWLEVKEKKDTNGATIQNTLRRIIEYYYKILGDFGNFDQIINSFESEEEQVICRSLISWLHDGSHNINEEMYVDNNPNSVARYLNVFKGIFKQTGHEAHYEMMTNKFIE